MQMISEAIEAGVMQSLLEKQYRYAEPKTGVITQMPCNRAERRRQEALLRQECKRQIKLENANG